MFVLVTLYDSETISVQAVHGLFPTTEEARAHGWTLHPEATELDEYGRYCEADTVRFQVVEFRTVPIAGTIPTA